jgi:hypothetical protein
MKKQEEEVTVRFYNIERSGYYKRVAEETNHDLCDTFELFDDLKRWVTGKTLEETKTSSALPRNSSLPTYCLGVEKSKDDHFLITTWNEIQSTDGQIASISKTQKIDDIKDVEMTPLPDDNIPGYSTYFWIIPEDNVLATVRFKHLEVGHERLNIYLRGFLTAFSKYTIKVQSPKDKTKYEIQGYGESKDDYDSKRHPYFRSKLIRKAGPTDYIIKNANNISKMIRKKVLEHQVSEDKIFIADAFKNLFGIKNKKLKEPLVVKYEMNYIPTEDETKNIIKEWQNQHDETWDDIGFNFKGEGSSTHWLSNEIPTHTFKMSIDRLDDELVQSKKLLDFLDSKYKMLKKLYS